MQILNKFQIMQKSKREFAETTISNHREHLFVDAWVSCYDT